MDESNEVCFVVRQLVKQSSTLVAVTPQLEQRAVVLVCTLLVLWVFQSKVFERGKRPVPECLRVVRHPRQNHHKRRRMVSFTCFTTHALFFLLM